MPDPSVPSAIRGCDSTRAWWQPGYLPTGGPWLCAPPSREVCPWHLWLWHQQYRPRPLQRLSPWTFVLLRRNGDLRVAPRLKRSCPAAPRAGDLVRGAAEARDDLAAPAAGRASLSVCA